MKSSFDSGDAWTNGCDGRWAAALSDGVEAIILLFLSSWVIYEISCCSDPCSDNSSFGQTAASGYIMIYYFDTRSPVESMVEVGRMENNFIESEVKSSEHQTRGAYIGNR